MESLAGHLLFASTQLGDENFVKTVVLLIQHSEQGALGVVVNRPTCKTIKELWQEVGDARCECEQPVYLGGPVSGPLMSVHTDGSLAEVEILPGLFFAAKKNHLDELVLQRDHAFKLFIGHAAWSPGQLEDEIEAGAWRTTPATTEYVFYEGEGLWEDGSKRMGASMLQSILKIKHVPEDPSMN